jgi:hypothetical protein
MKENDDQCADPHIVETFDTPNSVAIEETLLERGGRYGSFTGHARITQNIKRAMIDSPNWLALSDDKREALDMVAHKVGRILNGDPEYKDSWHDIIGYTKLVEDTLSD